MGEGTAANAIGKQLTEKLAGKRQKKNKEEKERLEKLTKLKYERKLRGPSPLKLSWHGVIKLRNAEGGRGNIRTQKDIPTY